MVKNKWFIIAALFPLLSYSQENSSRSSFNTVASLGIIAGESAAKPLFQVVSGFAFKKKWFTGIGVGLDYYRFKSIPLFVDCKMKFGKAGAGFLYADGGYNIPFDNKSEVAGSFETSNRFLGGVYMDAGIGYRVKLNSFHRISFSAGYSRKNIVNKIVNRSSFCPGGTCPEDVYKYRYLMGRIITRFSWEFGK